MLLELFDTENRGREVSAECSAPPLACCSHWGVLECKGGSAPDPKHEFLPPEVPRAARDTPPIPVWGKFQEFVGVRHGGSVCSQVRHLGGFSWGAV